MLTSSIQQMALIVFVFVAGILLVLCVAFRVFALSIYKGMQNPSSSLPAEGSMVGISKTEIILAKLRWFMTCIVLLECMGLY